MADRTVSVRLDALVSTYIAKMAQAAGATKAFGVSTLSAKGGVGGLGSASLVAGGAIAVGMGVAVKSALNFENAMTKVRINSNLTDAEINHLRGSILSLAGETGQAPKELADGLYFLASAGLSASQVQQTLEMSAKASAIGLGEVADIARLTATALNAYAKDGITAAEVTDTLAAAIRVGTAEPDEFANALGRIMPIAQKAGVEFDEVTGALAGLSNIGLDVNEGVTAMRGLLQALVAPTTQTKDALADLGITTDELRTIIAEDGIVAALRFLEEATDGNIDKLRDLIPNVRAITGAFGLTGQEAKKLDDAMRQVTDAEGDLSSAFQEWLEGPGAGVARLFAKLQVLAIKLGDILLPLFNDVVKMLGGVVGVLGNAVDLFTRLPQPIQQATLAVGALALATKALGVSFLGLGKGALGLGATVLIINEVAKAFQGLEDKAKAEKIDEAMGRLKEQFEAGELSSKEFMEASKALWDSLPEGSSRIMENSNAWLSLVISHGQATASLEAYFKAGGKLGDTDAEIHQLSDAFLRHRDAVEAAQRTYSRFAGMSRKKFTEWANEVSGAIDGVESALAELSGDMNVTAAEWEKAFRKTIRALGNYESNLRTVEKRNIPDDLLKQIVSMGTEGAGILEFLANASQREFRKYVGQAGAAERKTKDVKGAIDALPDKASVRFEAPGLSEMLARTEAYSAAIREVPATVSTNFSTSGGGIPRRGADVGAVVRGPATVSIGPIRELVHFTPISQMPMAPSTPAATAASVGGRSGPVEIVGRMTLENGKAWFRGTLREVLREP